MELDLQVSPEEIMSREVELGCESWTSFASSCSSTAVQARQLKQQLRSALVAGQWRGDTAITFPLFWRRSPVFFGRACTLSSSSPLSPSLISNLASVDVKQHGEGSKLFCDLIGVQMQLNGEDMQRRGDAGKLNVD